MTAISNFLNFVRVLRCNKTARTFLCLCISIFVLIHAARAQVSLDDIEIEAEHGTILERYTAPAQSKHNFSVLCIQDAHQSLEGQIQIKNLVETVTSKFGIGVVGVEGALGFFPEYQDLNKFPLREVREEVSRFYLEKGFLTGAEQAAITGNRPFRLVGVEDESIFRESFLLFNRLNRFKPDAEKFRITLEKVFSRLKANIFSAPLAEFDRKSIAFDRGYLSFDDWMKTLDYYRVQLPSSTLPAKNLDLIREILRLDARGADPSELDQPSYKRRIDGLKDAVEFRDLTREMESLVQEIKLALAKSVEERQVIQLESAGITLSRMILLEAQRKDTDAFFKERSSYELNTFLDELKRLSRRNGVWVNRDLSADHFQSILRDGVRFYELANRRDEILTDGLINYMKLHGETMAVLVSGGYHTEGMKKIFRNKGVSYAVLAPHLDHPGYSFPVVDRMTGKLFPLDESLASYFVALTKPINPRAHERMVRDIRLGFRDETAFVLRKPEILLEAGRVSSETFSVLERVLQRITEDAAIRAALKVSEGNFGYFQKHVRPKLEEWLTYEQITGPLRDEIIGFFQARLSSIALQRNALPSHGRMDGEDVDQGEILTWAGSGFGTDAGQEKLIELIRTVRAQPEKSGALKALSEEVQKQSLAAAAILNQSPTVASYIKDHPHPAFGVVLVQNLDGLGHPNATMESLKVDGMLWPSFDERKLALIVPRPDSPLKPRLKDHEALFSHVDWFIDDVEGFRLAAQKAITQNEVEWRLDEIRYHTMLSADSEKSLKLKSQVVVDRKSGSRIVLLQISDEYGAFPRRPWVPTKPASAGAEAYHATGEDQWHIVGFDYGTDLIVRSLPGQPAQKRYRILDLGVGTGLATEALVNRLVSLGIDAEHTGLDVNPGWMTKGFHVLAGPGAKQPVKLYLQRNPMTGEIEKDLVVSLGEGIRFDLVHALNVIHLIPDRSLVPAFRNVARVLPAEGNFVTSSGNIEDPERHAKGLFIIQDLVRGIRKESLKILKADETEIEKTAEFSNGTFPTPRPQSVYDKAFEEAGFVPGKTEKLNVTDTAEAWRRFVLSPDLWDGVLPELKENKPLQEQVLNQGADAFFAQFPDGKVTLQWVFQVSTLSNAVSSTGFGVTSVRLAAEMAEQISPQQYKIIKGIVKQAPSAILSGSNVHKPEYDLDLIRQFIELEPQVAAERFAKIMIPMSQNPRQREFIYQRFPDRKNRVAHYNSEAELLFARHIETRKQLDATVGAGFGTQAQANTVIIERYLSLPFDQRVNVAKIPSKIGRESRQQVSLEMPAEVIMRHMPFSAFMKGKHAYSWARLLDNENTLIKIGFSSPFEIARVKERIGFDQDFFSERARRNVVFVPSAELDADNIVIVRGRDLEAQLLRLPIGEYLRLIELLPHFLLAVGQYGPAIANPAIFHLEGNILRVDTAKLEALASELELFFEANQAVLQAA